MSNVESLDRHLESNKDTLVEQRKERMSMSQEFVEEKPECRLKLEEFTLEDYHKSQKAEFLSIRTPKLNPYQTRPEIDFYNIQVAYDLVPESLKVPKYVLNGEVELNEDSAEVYLEDGTETTIGYSPLPSEVKHNPQKFIEKVLNQ